MKKWILGLCLVVFLMGWGVNESKKELDISKIKIGLSKAEVISLFGKPNRINFSSTLYSSPTEQWVYEDSQDYTYTDYLYFQNDVLSSWNINQSIEIK